MQVIDESEFRGRHYHDFSTIIAFAEADAGKWVGIDEAEPPGHNRISKQPRLLQVAIKTSARQQLEGKVLVMCEGRLER